MFYKTYFCYVLHVIALWRIWYWCMSLDVVLGKTNRVQVPVAVLFVLLWQSVYCCFLLITDMWFSVLISVDGCQRLCFVIHSWVYLFTRLHFSSLLSRNRKWKYMSEVSMYFVVFGACKCIVFVQISLTNSFVGGHLCSTYSRSRLWLLNFWVVSCGWCCWRYSFVCFSTTFAAVSECCKWVSVCSYATKIVNQWQRCFFLTLLNMCLECTLMHTHLAIFNV